MIYINIYIYCLCIVSVAVEFVLVVANCPKFLCISLFCLTFSKEALVLVAIAMPDGQIVLSRGSIAYKPGWAVSSYSKLYATFKVQRRKSRREGIFDHWKPVENIHGIPRKDIYCQGDVWSLFFFLNETPAP